MRLSDFPLLFLVYTLSRNAHKPSISIIPISAPTRQPMRTASFSRGQAQLPSLIISIIPQQTPINTRKPITKWKYKTSFVIIVLKTLLAKWRRGRNYSNDSAKAQLKRADIATSRFS